MKRTDCVLAAIAAVFMHGTGSAADHNGPAPRIFGATQVKEVYRVLLDRDALLLESINDVIKQNDIQDGHVLISAGSVQECTYHYVTSTAIKPKNEHKTVKGPFEILSAGGIIAAGQPHRELTDEPSGPRGPLWTRCSFEESSGCRSTKAGQGVGRGPGGRPTIKAMCSVEEKLSGLEP